MNLVIVESPAKAKTINKYLGKDYLVLASYGHIRDLPSKNGSVDPDKNFSMLWEIDSFSKKYLTFFLCRISTNTPTKVNAAIAKTNPCIAIAGTISAKVEKGLLVIIVFLYKDGNYRSS